MIQKNIKTHLIKLHSTYQCVYTLIQRGDYIKIIISQYNIMNKLSKTVYARQPINNYIQTENLGGYANYNQLTSMFLKDKQVNCKKHKQVEKQAEILLKKKIEISDYLLRKQPKSVSRTSMYRDEVQQIKRPLTKQSVYNKNYEQQQLIHQSHQTQRPKTKHQFRVKKDVFVQQPVDRPATSQGIRGKVPKQKQKQYEDYQLNIQACQTQVVIQSSRIRLDKQQQKKTGKQSHKPAQKNKQYHKNSQIDEQFLSLFAS